MRSIRNDFSSRKDEYDLEIARSVPHYRRMLESAIDSCLSNPMIYTSLTWGPEQVPWPNLSFSAIQVAT